MRLEAHTEYKFWRYGTTVISVCAFPFCDTFPFLRPPPLTPHTGGYVEKKDVIGAFRTTGNAVADDRTSTVKEEIIDAVKSNGDYGRKMSFLYLTGGWTRPFMLFDGARHGKIDLHEFQLFCVQQVLQREAKAREAKLRTAQQKGTKGAKGGKETKGTQGVKSNGATEPATEGKMDLILGKLDDSNGALLGGGGEGEDSHVHLGGIGAAATAGSQLDDDGGSYGMGGVHDGIQGPVEDFDLSSAAADTRELSFLDGLGKVFDHVKKTELRQAQLVRDSAVDGNGRMSTASATTGTKTLKTTREKESSVALIALALKGGLDDDDEDDDDDEEEEEEEEEIDLEALEDLDSVGVANLRDALLESLDIRQYVSRTASIAVLLHPSVWVDLLDSFPVEEKGRITLPELGDMCSLAEREFVRHTVRRVFDLIDADHSETLDLMELVESQDDRSVLAAVAEGSEQCSFLLRDQDWVPNFTKWVHARRRAAAGEKKTEKRRRRLVEAQKRADQEEGAERAKRAEREKRGGLELELGGTRRRRGPVVVELVVMEGEGGEEGGEEGVKEGVEGTKHGEGKYGDSSDDSTGGMGEGDDSQESHGGEEEKEGKECKEGGEAEGKDIYHDGRDDRNDRNDRSSRGGKDDENDNDDDNDDNDDDDDDDGDDDNDDTSSNILGGSILGGGLDEELLDRQIQRINTRIQKKRKKSTELEAAAAAQASAQAEAGIEGIGGGNEERPSLLFAVEGDPDASDASDASSDGSGGSSSSSGGHSEDGEMVVVDGITFDEFAAFCATHMHVDKFGAGGGKGKGGSAGGASRATMQRIFDLIDTGKNGTISKDEIVAAVEGNVEVRRAISDEMHLGSLLR